MIRKNRKQRRCSCPERLQNRQTEHRLIRRGKLKAQYTGESKTTTPVKPKMPKHLRRCNTPETLKRKYEQNPDHRLIHWQAPVQPVIRKILPSPERIFQLATLEKLDDRRAKSSPNLTKFCRHDHKGLVNISTERIDESLHDLGGIEGLPSKNGVFSRTQKTSFRRDS